MVHILQFVLVESEARETRVRTSPKGEFILHPASKFMRPDEYESMSTHIKGCGEHSIFGFNRTQTQLAMKLSVKQFLNVIIAERKHK
jgi:hypothetical protein